MTPKADNAAPTLGYPLYISFVLFGLAQLLPWNIYLKSVPYFRMRMGEDSLAVWISSSMSSAYTLCNFCTMLVLVLLRWDEPYFNTPQRVCIGMVGNAILMSLVALLVVIPLPSKALFGFVVGMASLAGSITAVLIKGLLGMAARFPPLLTPAMVAGQAMAGLLVSIASLFSAVGNKGAPTDAVGPVAYFITGAAVLLFSLAIFCLNLKRSTRFQLYIGGGATSRAEPDRDSENKKISTAMMRAVFSRIKFLAIGLTCCLAVTVSLFATFITSPRQDANEILQYLFIPAIFIIYDIGDLIGRWLPAFHMLAGHPKSRAMLISPYVRLALYAPLFVLLAPVNVSTKMAKNTIGPGIGMADLIYALLVFSLGLTNGYLNTLFLMHAPSAAVSEHRLTIETSPETSSIRPEDSGLERETGGSLMGLFLNIGLVAGSLSSFLWRSIL